MSILKNVLPDGSYFSFLEGAPQRADGVITIRRISKCNSIVTGSVNGRNVAIVMFDQPPPRSGDQVVLHGYGSEEVFFAVAMVNVTAGESTLDGAMDLHDRLDRGSRKYLLLGLGLLPLVLPAYYLVAWYRMRRYMKRLQFSVDSVMGYVENLSGDSGVSRQG